jgi:hypothetical protein
MCENFGQKVLTSQNISLNMFLESEVFFRGSNYDLFKSLVHNSLLNL